MLFPNFSVSLQSKSLAMRLQMNIECIIVTIYILCRDAYIAYTLFKLFVGHVFVYQRCYIVDTQM